MFSPLLALALSILPLASAFAQGPATQVAFAGKVTAISDSSITIRNKGVEKKLAIDSQTPVVDAANISEIKVGQIVAVRTDESGAKAVLIRAKWSHDAAGSSQASASASAATPGATATPKAAADSAEKN